MMMMEVQKEVQMGFILLALLPTKAKDIVCRFIIRVWELNGFWPLGNNRSIFI
jgi:hypothetical protein